MWKLLQEDFTNLLLLSVVEQELSLFPYQFRSRFFLSKPLLFLSGCLIVQSQRRWVHVGLHLLQQHKRMLVTFYNNTSECYSHLLQQHKRMLQSPSTATQANATVTFYHNTSECFSHLVQQHTRMLKSLSTTTRGDYYSHRKVR